MGRTITMQEEIRWQSQRIAELEAQAKKLRRERDSWKAKWVTMTRVKGVICNSEVDGDCYGVPLYCKAHADEYTNMPHWGISDE